MKSEKKCPHCGTWITWEKQAADQCGSCKQLLDSRAFEAKTEREEKEREFEENDFFRIREADGFLMRGVRRVGWVLHAIFALITWAFLWFVTTFSG